MNTNTLHKTQKTVRNAQKAYKFVQKNQRHIPAATKVLIIVGSIFAALTLLFVGVCALSIMVWMQTHGI